jgi:cobalamin biosynthesis Mg chelatase CobN
MIGMRRLSARLRGRHVLAASVLALLSLACLPILAQADSSEVQYNPAVPTATHGSGGSPSGGSAAHKSNASGDNSTSGGSANSGSSNGGSSKEGESKATTGGSANSGNGGNGGSGQPSPAKSPSHEGQTAAKPPGKQVASKEDEGDSSSPLVPILIAVAILAAISVGVVAMRQRRKRGGSGTRVSPEAS